MNATPDAQSSGRRRIRSKANRIGFHLVALPDCLLKNVRLLATLAGIFAADAASASDAQTSANAGSNGTAGATADYQGDRGWAHTDARTGRVNIANGVAVGVDQNGISLSVSNAIAPQHGPAVATNFNLNIGANGSVSYSGGSAVANSPVQREVYAGGGAGSNRPATASAGGSTDPHGRVDARTFARDSGPRFRPGNGARQVARIRR